MTLVFLLGCLLHPRCDIGVGMEIMKKHSSKTRDEVSMQLDLKASASQEENLTDHYIILRTLGKGSFAEVKLACHLHTKVKVAIKALENGKKNDQKNKTEIDIVKMLDHPNIIKVFHIISTEEHTYMVMEHASRGDLVTHIDKWGHLQEEQAQYIFTQIVCAVRYCHNGIAHRAIKLDNILLDGKGNIKLCDFGMAIRVISGQKSEGFCGTIEYCAPELFTGTDYDARAVDIWSMGVVLYAMVTVCFSFKAKTYSDMKETVNSSFPEEAKAVVESKMENKPSSSELQKMQDKQKLIKEPGLGMPVVLITTLLVIPVVVLLAIVMIIQWNKSRAFGGK
ncbi:hypothetical protein STEG23_001553 [Scotinomys teguina]